MAQILKDSVRNQIVQSAIQEIYANGLKKLSMRNIAKNANMTVGNLYRYFASKDALVASIVEPIINKIDQAIKNASNDKIHFLDVQSCAISAKDVNEAIENLANELIAIYDENPLVMKIIMKNEIVSQRITLWLVTLMSTLNNSWEGQAKDESYYYMLATSIIAGISYAFGNIEDREQLAVNFKLYLKQIVQVLGA
ncbi:MAG: TetR/AcrR family transcriptional regulator [Erysipelotrichaceae bacterium]|nr:TetR/AcrR family transcriptional regulator [Erysipelotrichaceae bacterium]MDY5252277.1 TetR/AcrR family transcriptional regulator [Erysipelotrichaceae bacterium]